MIVLLLPAELDLRIPISHRFQQKLRLELGLLLVVKAEINQAQGQLLSLFDHLGAVILSSQLELPIEILTHRCHGLQTAR
jgi:hypothetical protein